MSAPQRSHSAHAVVALGLTGALLAGCSAGSSAGSSATGSTSSSATGLTSSAAGNTSTNQFSAKLPEGFPSDVPLVDGVLAVSLKTAVTGGFQYVLTWTVDNTMESFATLHMRFAANGYAVSEVLTDEVGGTLTAEKGSVRVFVVASTKKNALPDAASIAFTVQQLA